MESVELAWKIRKHAIDMTNRSGSSHIACILSVADIIAVLYSHILHYDSEYPRCENRDRFILSKGHAGASVYAALAEVGFFDTDELKTHCSDGSRLSGHISHNDVPGIELSTGSLGHGLPVGVGFAIAAKMDKKKHRVYVVVGDGECNEGSIWESALMANHFQLDNLIVIIDHNRMQALDYCDNTLQISPLATKWNSFGWETVETDGHDHEAMRNSLLNIEAKGKPTVIIAETVKGKGVSFMENNILWHYRPPKGEDYERAIRELEATRP